VAALQWLSELSLTYAALVLTGGALLVSLIGTLIARSFYSEGQLSLNNVVGGFKFLALSQVYAIFLGFLLLGAYQRFDQVRKDIVAEAGALSALDRLSEAFSVGARDQLKDAVRNYAREVVDVEWPLMRQRNAALGTTAPLDTLDYVFAAVEPTSKKQQAVAKNARELLTVIRDMRSVRVLRSVGSMQVLLWVAVTVGTLGAMIFPWLFGTPNAITALLMSFLQIVLMTSLILVVLKLNFPFSGDQGAQPTPYVAFLNQADRP
jgi:hypothetical protein